MGDSDSIQTYDSIGAVTKSEKHYTHRQTNIHMPKNSERVESVLADEDFMMLVQERSEEWRIVWSDTHLIISV